MKNLKNLPKEEKLNVWSHGLGALVILLFMPFFFIYLPAHVEKGQILAFAYFFGSLIFLFLMSTLYHYHVDEKKKGLFRVLDHIGIVILISGSYVSFISYFLPTDKGFLVLSIHSAICLIAIAFKLFFTGRFEFLSLALYLSLGWMVVLIFQDMIIQMSPAALNLLIVGGISYTVGVVFYAIPKIPYNHFIWHLFVLVGSISHILSLSFDVLSQTN